MASTTITPAQIGQMSLPGFGAVPSITSGSYTVNTTAPNTIFTIQGSNGISYDDIKPNTLEVKGKAVFSANVEINGTLKVQGRELTDILDSIEQRLAILRPEPELEERWERLKAIGDEYRALAADIKEKEEIIRILKK